MSDELREYDEQGSVVKTSVSLPPYLHDWIKDVIRKDKKRFPSVSSVVVVALAELKGKMDYKTQLESQKADEHIQSKSGIELILEAYLNTREGREFLQTIISKEQKSTTLFNEDIPRKLRVD